MWFIYSLRKSATVMGTLFLAMLILGLFFPGITELTNCRKIYLLVFWVAVLIGNMYREYHITKGEK